MLNKKNNNMPYLVEHEGETFEKCFPLQRDSSSRAIPHNSGIGQPSGCPQGRSRRTAGESTRRFSADSCAQALEKRHYVQPQEYIEYFEDSAGASLRAKSEPDAEIGQKRGLFKGLKDVIVNDSFYLRIYCQL